MKFTATTLLALAATVLALPATEVQEKRQDDHAHADICTDANHGGFCINFGLRALGISHCWDFKNGGGIDLTAFNDHLSSIFPHEQGAVWTLYENFGCSGRSLGGIVAPGIDNLQSFGFNDIASSISVVFQ
ncbi:hypothetical protein CC78DRAFT_250932 [Lojkania enalia]|uniref:Uncharacterized protein n=1 Tax=Lojkania enalia TaxID=147567 RepID=A0A9P4MZX0_9PLEO|nr:hypothetical protein CC78DRAFT_250932 [Didymosphaeria enalia]